MEATSRRGARLPVPGLKTSVHAALADKHSDDTSVKIRSIAFPGFHNAPSTWLWMSFARFGVRTSVCNIRFDSSQCQ